MPTEEREQEIVKTSIDGIEIDGNIEDIIGNKEESNTEQKKPEPKKGDPDTEKSGELPSEFAESYKGKSTDELIGEIYKKQQHIGKLGNDLGEARKGKIAKVSPLQELEEEEDSLSSRLNKIDKQLKDDFDAELDSDDDVFKKLSKRKEGLLKQQRELSNKKAEIRISETVRKTMYSEKNKELLENQKADVTKQLGLEEIPNDHWDIISDKAQEYAGIGNSISKDDVQAAVIKTYGADFVSKANSINAQQKIRNDIASASQKTMPILIGKQGGINLENMTDEQQIKMIDHLEKTKQYAALDAFSKKIKAMRRQRS